MWHDVDVDIDHGIVDLHVTFNGKDVVDAPVYLFATSSSYLGRDKGKRLYFKFFLEFIPFSLFQYLQ